MNHVVIFNPKDFNIYRILFLIPSNTGKTRYDTLQGQAILLKKSNRIKENRAHNIEQR